MRFFNAQPCLRLKVLRLRLSQPRIFGGVKRQTLSSHRQTAYVTYSYILVENHFGPVDQSGVSGFGLSYMWHY